MNPGDTLAHYKVTKKTRRRRNGGDLQRHRHQTRPRGRPEGPPSGLTADPTRLTRFRNEARALASVQHPNVASIYGLEEVDDQLFLVMELAEGEDLSNRIARGPLPLDQALEVASQIANGRKMPTKRASSTST